ncbi:hypothetical protein [Shimia sp.]|uniref:hypothetical protein n=1 Tax=unclassified Shimia TaxID=2630038 RepID=UPI0025D3A100|nr:hypothetical protein [Shimia sp.]MCH2069118.1 hypothetical protein [Shimia sp.]
MLHMLKCLALGCVAGGVVSLPQAHAEVSPKALYNEAMASLSDAPKEAIRTLQSICTDGYARACDRLGYFRFKGIGGNQDTAQAIAYYDKAVELGQSKSLVSLGKVQLSSQDYEAAQQSLLAASALGLQQGEAVLAWAHATGRLGPLSDPHLGIPTLVKLAKADSRDGQMLLLDALTRDLSQRVDVTDTLDQLHKRHADGDAKAAEALLKYYRVVGHARGTLATRDRLLQTEGLRAKIQVEEGLYLARDQNPAQFWRASEEIVRAAPNDVFARGLSVAAKINKNAYVRIVQMELRDLGYAVGRASPYMNRPLIRSINAFCRDTNQQSACLYGPLKSKSIKAVAGELAQVRAEL